jgi:hypothetical protein
MNDQAGDWQRLVSDATDTARQRRLSAATGGDAAVLAEVRLAQNRAALQNPPPLDVLARLAVHREALSQSHWWVPAELPTVWANLGRLGHAEKIAVAMPPGPEHGALWPALPRQPRNPAMWTRLQDWLPTLPTSTGKRRRWPSRPRQRFGPVTSTVPNN